MDKSTKHLPRESLGDSYNSVVVCDGRGKIENHANHFGAESTKRLHGPKPWLLSLLIICNRKSVLPQSLSAKFSAETQNQEKIVVAYILLFVRHKIV